MNIELAYCEEFGKVVDIFEAQALYFESPRNQRRRFNFLCSEVSCRQNDVKVSGVNYDKLAEDTDKFVKPYFRSIKEHPHSLDCVWLIFETARKEIKQEGHVENVTGGHRSPKASDYVDVFTPKQSESELFIDEVKEVIDDLKKVGESRQKIEYIKQRFRRSKTKSTLLLNVVNCFLSMNEQMKRQSKLALGNGGTPRDYQDIFLHLSNFSFHNSQEYIVYGGATVSKTVKNDDQTTGYRIKFYDRIVQQNSLQEQKEYSSQLYLSISRISGYKKGAHLKAMLDEVSNSKSEYVQVFFYGSLNLSQKYENVSEVQISHLDNLVLIRRSKTQK